MASNYPPGVTGSEYAIAGPDYERESDTPCPYVIGKGEDSLPCGEPTMELGYQYERWLVCDKEHITDPEPEETKCEKCAVALGHYGRWVKSYYREALGACKHLSEGECWEDRCRGGRKT